MVIEIVFNNEIQIFYFQIYLYFWKEKYIFVYIIEKTLKLNFIFSFEQNFNKISNMKNDVLCNLLNKIG
jgi:hypothetical protein